MMYMYGKLPTAILFGILSETYQRISNNQKIYISKILIYVVSNVSMPVAQPLNISATQARTPLEPKKLRVLAKHDPQ